MTSSAQEKSNRESSKISFGLTKDDENNRRNWLKNHKPRVYEKVTKFEEKIKKGESIAIIQFQYDYTCNFKCEHCSIEKFQVPKKEQTKDPRRYFKLDDVRELSRQADEMGLANFVITGGEPLMFRDFDQLVEAIDPQKFYLVSDTNGWLLDYEKAKHLKEIGVDKLQLSLDGLDAKQHDEFRRKKGSYDKVVKGIEACKEAGLHVILSTVVWKERVKSQEFIDFLEFAKKKEVGTYVTYAKPVGAYEGRFDVLVNEDDCDYVKELEKKYDVFTHLTPSYGLDLGCIAVKRMVPITKYGDVMPCPYTHVSLGNFFEEPLEDIIKRGLNIKWFDPKEKKTCLCGVDRNFIDNVVAKTYGKHLPVHYSEIFNREDYIKNNKG